MSSLQQGKFYRITCIDNNLVVDAARGHRQVWSCKWHGGDNQIWELGNKSENIWTLCNKADGQGGAIDAPFNQTDATHLQPLHGKPNQQFALEPIYPDSYIYFMRNVHFNKYVQANGENSRVTLVEKKDINNKKTQFAFAEMDFAQPDAQQSMLKQGEQYKIICVENNLVIDGTKGAEKQVWGWDWNAGDNQTWELENISGNIWTLFNKNDGRGGRGTIDAPSADSVHLWTLHGREHQQFALEPLYPGSYVHFIRSIRYNKYLQLNGKGGRVTLVPKDYNNKKTQFVFAEMDLTHKPMPVPEKAPEPKPVPEKASEPKPVPEKAPEPKPAPEPEPEAIVKPGEEHREIRFGDDEVLDGSEYEVKIAKKKDGSDQIWHFNQSKTGYTITIHYPTHGSSKVLSQENGKLVLKESGENETQTWKFVPTGSGSFQHFLVHSGTGNVIQNNGIGNGLTVVPKDPSNPKQKCSSVPTLSTKYTVIQHKPSTPAYTIVYKTE